MEIQTPVIMDRIASFLSHDDLKFCRQLNSAWKLIANRTLKLRKSTEIQISPKSIKRILKSTEVFWNSVNLDWTFGDSVQGDEDRNDIERFFQKYGQFVERLNWSGADLRDQDHKLSTQQLGEFLHLMPNLQELRFGTWDQEFYWNYYHYCCTPASNILRTLQNLPNLAKLKLNSFHISHQACLDEWDFDVLAALAPKLHMKKFSYPIV